MSAQEFVKYAASIVGGSSKLAQALDITPSVITHWSLPSEDRFFRRVPAERCPEIEALTHGQVRCEDLRPDVNWGVLRGTAAPKQKEAA